MDSYAQLSEEALDAMLAPSDSPSPTHRGSYQPYRRHRAIDDNRCRYPSKTCTSMRVAKTCGALHRFCAYHRNRANVNQKRWVDRQRGEHPASPTGSPTTSAFSSLLSSPSSCSALSPTHANTKHHWISGALDSPPLSPTKCKSTDCKTKQEDISCATTASSVNTLSEDDWSSLFAILASGATESSCPAQVTV